MLQFLVLWDVKASLRLTSVQIALTIKPETGPRCRASGDPNFFCIVPLPHRPRQTLPLPIVLPELQSPAGQKVPLSHAVAPMQGRKTLAQSVYRVCHVKLLSSPCSYGIFPRSLSFFAKIRRGVLNSSVSRHGHDLYGVLAQFLSCLAHGGQAFWNYFICRHGIAIYGIMWHVLGQSLTHVRLPCDSRVMNAITCITKFV